MHKKYEIIWGSPNQGLLRVKFMEDCGWSEILEANLLALDMIALTTYDMVLFNDTQGFKVDNSSIGAVKDLLFNHLPNASKNLKGVVVLVTSQQKFALEMGIETVSVFRYGRKFMQVVDSVEKAEIIFQERLGRQK